jgi:hypothetical protein
MQRKGREPGKVLDSRNIGWFLRQKKICKDDEKIVTRNGWPMIEKKNVTEITIAGIERIFRKWINPGKARLH